MHTAADSLGTLTLDYLGQGVRAVLAAAAELAQPAVVPAAPTGLAARSQLSRSLFIQAKTVALRWDANRDEVVGYFVYRTTVPGGPYLRLSSVPQAGLEFTDRFLNAKTTYYYAITAVNAGGRESGFSLEVADSETAGNGWPDGNRTS
jgi:fibronectin type 3 domain-containing protein